MQLLAWSGVAALVCMQACTPAQPASPVLKVRPNRPDAQIRTSTRQGQTVIEVSSPSGIGSADFEIAAGPEPRRIVLRLLLQGLEQLDFSYGETTITVSVSSRPGRELRESARFSSSEAEQELAPGSPYWMAVSIVPASSPGPTAPAEGGAIEVQAPEDYLRSGLKAFSIRWTDFFR
jgi:hypothetical protein